MTSYRSGSTDNVLRSIDWWFCLLNWIIRQSKCRANDLLHLWSCGQVPVSAIFPFIELESEENIMKGILPWLESLLYLPVCLWKVLLPWQWCFLDGQHLALTYMVSLVHLRKRFAAPKLAGRRVGSELNGVCFIYNIILFIYKTVRHSGPCF